jgi:hypothetical protein
MIQPGGTLLCLFFFSGPPALTANPTKHSILLPVWLPAPHEHAKVAPRPGSSCQVLLLRTSHPSSTVSTPVAPARWSPWRGLSGFFFILVLFLDFTCPSQCASHTHTHMAYCFHLFLTGLDMTLRGVRFLRNRFMRPPAHGRISPMILRKTRSNTAILTRPQSQPAKKHDAVDVQDVVNEVGSCVLACSCSYDLFIFILFFIIKKYFMFLCLAGHCLTDTCTARWHLVCADIVPSASGSRPRHHVHQPPPWAPTPLLRSQCTHPSPPPPPPPQPQQHQ